MNQFSPNGLTKIEKIRLQEFEQKRAEEIDAENKGVQSLSEWAEDHGARQNEEGEWEV